MPSSPLPVACRISCRIWGISNCWSIPTATIPHHTGATGAVGTYGIDNPLTDEELEGLGDAFVIETHNVEALAASLLDFDNLWAGLDKLLEFLQSALANRVFGQRSSADWRQLRRTSQFIEEIRYVIRGSASNTVETVQQWLFDKLGPSRDLDVLVLEDIDNNSVIDFHNVPAISEYSEEGQLVEALFDLNLGKTSKLLSTPIYFDIGIPGLGLEIPHTDEQEPTVDVNLGWGFNLGFGVSRMDGFFLDTSAKNELNVDVTATIPGFQAVGTLGFLQLNVTDNQADPSRLEMGFAIDITDLQGGNDRLTWNEMTSQGFDPFKMVDATARGLRQTASTSISIWS